MTTTTLPVTEKSGILRLLHENEPAIRSFGVRRLGLFGSFQRDEARADSDVDLFVEFEPSEATFDHFMDLSFFAKICSVVGSR